ncbi:unnamed protein product, partial [Mesorhabditis spiculigera]
MTLPILPSSVVPYLAKTRSIPPTTLWIPIWPATSLTPMQPPIILNYAPFAVVLPPKNAENVYACGTVLEITRHSIGHRIKNYAPRVALPKRGAVNPFTFKEHAIEMDQEYVASDLFEGISDSEDDCEDEKEADIKRRLADYNNFLNSRSDKEEIAGGDEEEDEKDQKDVAFLKFSRLVELNPDQILRYVRGGEPLPATLKAPPLSSPPNCEICGGARSFEMQLMPNLLSILELDSIGKSVDWASIYIYTCANSCNIPDLGYAREFVIKHDFAS